MNWNNNTPPKVNSKTCSFCLICFKTIGKQILKNCVWGDQFLYQRIRRLNYLNIATESTLPHCCPALCPGLRIVVLSTNMILWSLSTTSFFLYLPCPFGTLISILLFSSSSHFNLFPSPFTFPYTKLSHITLISTSSPVLLLSTMPTPFSSCFLHVFHPTRCVYPLKVAIHVKITLLSRMPQKIHRDDIRVKSNISANR